MTSKVWVHTFTGKEFTPLDPQIKDICIEDIAHSLSNICRFNGHTSAFYSVAEHSVLLSRMVSPEAALSGLMHDAQEAYLCDIVSPIKHAIPGLVEVESRLWAAVCQAFDIYPSPEIQKEIKEADMKLLATEMVQLMPPGRPYERCKGYTPLDVPLDTWSPRVAKEAFLMRFKYLRGL